MTEHSCRLSLPARLDATSRSTFRPSFSPQHEITVESQVDMASHFLYSRIYHDEPPAFQGKSDTNPTLLVSWFCTIFALVAILIRVIGRWARTEKLFREDKIMCYSIIPLLIRMALVHVILIWGTNNTPPTGLDPIEIKHREIGSKLVLAARIFYAAFIWVAKVTVCEFLKRLIGTSWHKTYELGIRLVYGFLGVTFVFVVVATLAECQPFDHYWQVVPLAAPKCREGLAQLMTMGVCDIVTDLALILFPIPMVLASAMTLKRKMSLVFLFLLSVILIAITAYRVPSTISRRAPQQFRSLLASVEILVASGVANAIVIASFIRDKGVKKAKFRAQSTDNSTISRVPTRKSIAERQWGSDEDLARGLGFTVSRSLRHASSADQVPRPAPIAPPGDIDTIKDMSEKPRRSTLDASWNFASAARSKRRKSSIASDTSSTATHGKLQELRSQLEDRLSPSARPETSGMGFFDVGGLVDKPVAVTSAKTSRAPSQNPPHERSPMHVGSSSHQFLSDVGGLLSDPGKHDEIKSTPSVTDVARSASRPRHLSPFRHSIRAVSRERRSAQFGDVDREAAEQGPDSLQISDAGGLLR